MLCSRAMFPSWWQWEATDVTITGRTVWTAWWHLCCLLGKVPLLSFSPRSPSSYMAWMQTHVWAAASGDLGASGERNQCLVLSLTTHHPAVPMAQSCFAWHGWPLHLLPPYSNPRWGENHSWKGPQVPELLRSVVLWAQANTELSRHLLVSSGGCTALV